jgi:hypothetical protein
VYSVYRGCLHEFTTPSLGRAVAVVRGYLDEYVRVEHGSTDLLRLLAAALVYRDQAILVPWQARHSIPTLEMRLRAHEVRVVEGVSVEVDTRAAHLVVPPPLVGSSAGRGGSVIASDDTAQGRYHIRAWLVRAAGSRETTRAGLVAEALGLVYGREDPAVQLGRLADLVTAVDIQSYRQWGELPALVKARVAASTSASASPQHVR